MRAATTTTFGYCPTTLFGLGALKAGAAVGLAVGWLCTVR